MDMSFTECNVRVHTYSPVGHCIYCNRCSPEVVLTQEHIIPKAIKGYLKLPESSCTECADIHKSFEQKVLRKMFGVPRIQWGLGWQRKKEQPKYIGGVQIDKGDGFVPIDLPPEDIPHALVFPVFWPPGILTSPEPQDPKTIRLCFLNVLPTQANVQQLGSPAPVKITQKMPIVEFLRMVAKISHSYALAELKDEFDPVLLDIIAGRRNDFYKWIGCPGNPEPAPNHRSDLHSVQIFALGPSYKDDNFPWIAVEIQLFSVFNAPVYQVIVGRSLVPVARLPQ